MLSRGAVLSSMLELPSEDINDPVSLQERYMRATARGRSALAREIR